MQNKQPSQMNLDTVYIAIEEGPTLSKFHLLERELGLVIPMQIVASQNNTVIYKNSSACCFQLGPKTFQLNFGLDCVEEKETFNISVDSDWDYNELSRLYNDYTPPAEAKTLSLRSYLRLADGSFWSWLGGQSKIHRAYIELHFYPNYDEI